MAVPEIFQDSGVPEADLKALSDKVAAHLDDAVVAGMPPNAIAGVLFGMFQSAIGQVESPFLKRAGLRASLENLQEQLVAMGNAGMIL